MVIWIFSRILVFFVPKSLTNKISLVGSLALIVWSLQELFTGVNKFRKLLGLIILTASIIQLASKI